MLGVGLGTEPRRTWFAYLAAWVTAVTIGIGGLLLLMVGHAAKASWMVVTRRTTEAVAGTLSLSLALFVPVIAGSSALYPWVLAPDEHKRRYLNVPAFAARGILYLLIFVLVGALLRRWSLQNDARPSLQLVRRMRRLAGGGLPVVGLATTWASFDWLMSLQPAWWSTIFGLYVFSGAFVGAIALVCLMVRVAPPRVGDTLPTGDHAQALGRLLFAMVSFWAYMAFSQLLIDWIGDVPAEITFYARRMTGSWTAVTYLLVVGHFVLPFFALLPRRWKRSRSYLAAVGAWMLLMHFLDVYWLVLPVCDVAGARPSWLDAGAVLFVGGLSTISIAWHRRAAPLMPRHDPGLAEGIDYEAAV
jgi:hypothetical protein